MEKLLKYLMLMLVATFSLTFVSCGDDDDEPKPDETNISKNLLIGYWIGDPDQTCTLTFNPDGSYRGYYRTTYYGNPYVKEEIGTYSLKGDVLTLEGSLYIDNEYLTRFTNKWSLHYDDYTNKLVFEKIISTSIYAGHIISYGHLYKAE